ncbi:Synaptojanin-2 [Gurleya vavrai]
MELENVKESVIFRVNCLDCLDRTNIAQFMIAENYFKDAFEDKKILFNILKDLFVKNGHALSNFYCGADSLKSELALKGKRTVTGIFDDLFINANRLISAKYNDKIKFEIINTMLEKEDKEIIKDFANFNLNENYHFYVLTWCLNNFKYDHKFNFDINIDKKISFVVISLQKINTSYKKLFFDEKQTERVKWKEYFEMKFCDFTLISQNFSHNLGLLLFTRNEIKMEITNINAIKTKKEIFSSLMSICINFNFRNKNFCIANSILQFEKSFIEKTKKHLNFINFKADYLFMTGYFQSKLFINEDEISFLFDTQEYEKIISNDFLYNHMDIIGNLEEGEISFLPNVEDLKKKDFKYSTRIFFNEFCKSLEYKDIEVTKTGFKPVYGIFYLKK